MTDIDYVDGSGNQKIPLGDSIKIKNLRARVRATPTATTGNITAKIYVGNNAAASEQFEEKTISITVDTTWEGIRGSLYPKHVALMT